MSQRESRQRESRQRERIAIVGMALRYPDAKSPNDLWENVLAGRRAFRRLPDERMRQADYYSPDKEAPDRFYASKAAVLEGFEFDRVGFKIAGSTYRSTDMTHWLALDVAAGALADAGFPMGEGLPKEATGVVIGNSLTGEFSRASMMRLRWPYVKRTVGAALAEQGWGEDALGAFLDSLEQRYKSPFPPVDEDTLAGGLANTIAGRVCNYFDLNGGGYTVDGACSSSLLSVATACKALVDSDIDVGIAGGVDLSIDPFEVIGFAKTGALATGEMRVYDRNSNGFWPGEGCGMLVLMRESDAIARGSDIHGYIAGWGMSSDGKGGMTRPEVHGHALAIKRAYARAGFGPDTVSYFEGHGTGTAVGDETELKALSLARRTANPQAEPAALGTVKGNIGHTKAAAGVVGLIKATLAVYHQVIPPSTGHIDAHPVLTPNGQQPVLRVPAQAEPWPADKPVRAGVSSMGFGGINTHIVVESPDTERRPGLDQRTTELVSSRQDAELLLLDATSLADLRGRIAQLASLAPRLAYAELADLAGALQRELADRPLRAAVVAANPEEAEQRLTRLLALLDGGARSVLSVTEGIFFGRAAAAARIAYLFPGQGSGRGGGGALRRRFAEVDELYRRAALPEGGDQVATAVAQPRIVTGSVAGLRALDLLGVQADVAVGHSLGELTALHWAGAMDEETLLRTAAARGRVMAEASREGGTMASIAAGPDVVEPLLDGEPVGIAGYNSPTQTVVSGPVDAVGRVQARAEEQGLAATRLSVSHAFHSPMVEPAAAGLAEHLAGESLHPVQRRMISTVSADALPEDVDVRALLRDQVLQPVRFAQAAGLAADEVDLVLEVGPGRVLTGLTGQIAPYVPVLPLDTDGPSLTGLLRAAGAAWVLGAPVRHAVLFAGRPNRPLKLDGEFVFLASPCEAAPVLDISAQATATAAAAPALAPIPQGGAAAVATAPAPTAPGGSNPAGSDPTGSGSGGSDDANLDGDSSASTLELVLRLAAERAELPVEAVGADSHPLDDLHLSSITVGQIMNQVTRKLGRPALSANSSYATATLSDLAQMIDDLGETALPADTEEAKDVPGVAPWVRSFALDLVPTDRPAAAPAGTPGSWQVFSTDGHPLATPLREGLEQAGIGDGVLLCLPADCDEGQVELFLEAARGALASNEPTRFVVVQHGRGAAGLAKTLHLEAPQVTTTLVDLPLPAQPSAEQVADAAARVVADSAATTGFSEVRYDEAGTRRVPVFRPLPQTAEPVGPTPLGPDDVLLVTGGGKGITAECALALAKDTGAAIALLGRSDPAGDTELAANLYRLTDAGVRFRYVRADVTDATAVRSAVDEVASTLGAVTAVLHGAGRNEPAPLTGLDADHFRATLAPKISGLRAVLDAVDPAALKLLVTFGSIIGRAGLRGEAHYSTANDWMTELTLEVAEQHPQCRCLALEWSVWSGAGMGEKLGVVEALVRDGIHPIPTDEGIATMQRLLADPNAGPVVLVMGRAAGLPTLTLEQRELPLLRFVERPLVDYPGIELVTEAELSDGGDLYLPDHLLDGDLLFPAVLGMEAMAQAAAAVTGRTGTPVLENAEFLRPIAAPPGGSVTVRVAVLVRDENTVDAAIRSSDTAFGADHFRATLRYDRPALPEPAAVDRESLPRVPVDPAAELYGGVLFQGDRFQRLLGYHRLAAREAVADISNESPAPWFGAFLPQRTVLADPGTRDAMMHSIQCCIPNATLLPAGIERLWLAEPGVAESTQVVLHAAERSQTGDTFVYDVNVLDHSGELVERWEGLRLQAVRKQDGRGPWVPPLLGPHLTRSLEDVVGGPSLAVAVEPDGDGSGHQPARQEQTAVALSRAVGRPVQVHHRPDGKPECDAAKVSVSHGAGVTFAVAGPDDVACDVETVIPRSTEDWDGLLWPALRDLRGLLVRESDEDSNTVATRLWTAVECIRKTGAVQQPVTLESSTADGWVVFGVGERRVATFLTTLHGLDSPVVFAVMTKGRS
jgi:enediyne polyketide synthase